MKHTVHEVKLSNGAQGLIVDIPDSKAIGFNLSFRAGSYFCPAQKDEVAHFLEHMICTANEKYDKKSFMVEISKNGAYTNASTSDNDISYVAYCAEFEWERILNLFLLAITKPIFLEEHFIQEREVIRQELTDDLTNYNRRLIEETLKTINQTNSTTPASIESLKNITLKDLKEFYQKTHYVQNLRFIIAGNASLKINQIKQILENIDLPQSNQSRLPGFESPLKPTKKPISVHYPSVDKFYFYFNIIRPKRFTYHEWICVDLVGDILFGKGGISGLNARITGPARDKGLIYSIGGGAQNFHQYLAFDCLGRIEKENALDLFQLISEEITKLRRGQLTHQEFKALKEQVAGMLALSEPTTGSLLSHYAARYFECDEIIGYETYSKLLPSIQKKQILETLESIIAEKRWYLGLLGGRVSEHQDDLYNAITPIFAT